MAHNPINPRLRPWAQAGLKYLLLSPEKYQEIQNQLQKKLPPSRVQDATQQPAANPAKPTSSLQPAVNPAKPSPAPSPAKPTAKPASSLQPAVNPAKPSPPIPAKPTAQAASSLQPAPNPKLNPNQPWPSYWQELLQRTPKTPRFVWTYKDLARDLGGQADARHRDFLRHLVQDMNLPKGSHAFWPLTDWPKNQFTPNMFLQGIDKLKPEAVIFMVGNSPDIPNFYEQLNLPPLENISPEVIQGRRYLRTQAVLDLLDNPEQYHRLIAFLKSLLSN